MSNIPDLLASTAHRPYPLPKGAWQFYHQWHGILFLHWAIPFDVLRPHVPKQFQIDTFKGQCYVSYVVFSMRGIRPKNLFAFSPLSNFHEINVRTYIEIDGKAGVYFINIEAEKAISAFLSRQLSGLPYEYAKMSRTANSCITENKKKNFNAAITYEVEAPINHKSDLDIWLTERYCLYQIEQSQIYRCDIHHEVWDLKNVKINQLQLSYRFGDLVLGATAWDAAHYAEELEVLSWSKTKVV
jgi:uncharacterized protein